MNKWSFGKKVIVFLLVGFAALFVYRKFFTTSKFQMTSIDKATLSRNKILNLEINGVIINGKTFLKNLKKYKKEKEVKAIVIDINSPGGAVGPSQEVYYEILRAKNETKKPVVCVSTGLIASGGYYAALACDKIIVAPGTMIGSIGVIMEFANLERLYDWAKVQRYTIKSGKFKDSGAEYRSMTDEERLLFQNMVDEVYSQFKETVVTARNLPEDLVSQYADGRVMTGATAVKLKFADQEGTFEDAVRVAAQLAKLGDDYSVVKPNKNRDFNLKALFGGDEDEDDLNSIEGRHSSLGSFKATNGLESFIGSSVKSILKPELLNQPLYLMPGYL